MGSAAKVLALGLRWFERGELEEALALFEAARHVAEALDEPANVSEAWTHFGRASWLACEPKVAEHAFGEAAKWAEQAGVHDAVARARVREAFMAYDAGDLDRADRILDGVEALEHTAPLEVGMTLGYRANVLRSRGQLGPALATYERAIAALQAVDEAFYASTFRMDTAVIALLEGDLELARSRLQEARDAAEGTTDPILPALLGHYDLLALSALGAPELAAEARARFSAPSCVALDFIAETHDAVLALATETDPRELTQRIAALRGRCPPYEHGRLTLRFLRARVGSLPEDADHLVVREAETSLRLGSDLEIQFTATSPEWRIVLALVRAREADDGAALSRDVLIDAGWPGERMSDKSARNRLHVALSNLRKKGLREVLLRHHDGYALGQRVRIVRPPVLKT